MSEILSMIGSIFGAAGSSSEAEEESAYNQRLRAYEKAQRLIDKSNKERSERVNRRNQIMGAIGSKNRFLDPTLADPARSPKPADYDVAEALQQFGGIVSSLGGGSSYKDESDYASEKAEQDVYDAEREQRKYDREMRRQGATAPDTGYASNRGFSTFDSSFT